MKIASMAPVRTLLRRSCCCVPSPQSNSRTRPSSITATEATLRCRLGSPALVPRKTMRIWSTRGHIIHSPENRQEVADETHCDCVRVPRSPHGIAGLAQPAHRACVYDTRLHDLLRSSECDARSNHPRSYLQSLHDRSRWLPRHC